MSKITQYSRLTSPQSDDLLVVVDVHDTSMAATGTTKSMTLAAAGGVGAADYAPAGLTGATAASRYVGGTASGAPASGTFSVGDFAIDQSGKVWICTAAGTPGTWVAAGPTIPVGITQGGTGAASQQAAIDALTGTQSAGKVLRSDGTHATLSTLQAADLPAATTSAQGAVILDGTAADLQPDGVAAAGNKGQAADAKHVHPLQPWQFMPESYNSKAGDGIVCTVSTTLNNTTVVATSAVFTSTAVDGGKYFMIHGANGATGGPLLTTISTVTDSTHAVLAAAPTATVSACPAVFGTDCTAAINSALSAAGTYATSNGYFAEVVFGPKVYILGSGPTKSGDGSTAPTFNAQLTLPYPAANGTSRKMVITLTGAGDAGYCQYWESTTPNLAGTCLVSMLNPSSSAANDPTFGRQCVLGGPSGTAGFTGGYANVKAVVKGISVWCPIYTNLYALDMGYVSAWRWQQSSAHIFAPTGVNGGVQPYLNAITATAFTNSTGSGIRTPVQGNNDAVHMDDCTVEGYECGYRTFDHAVFPNIRGIYCDVIMKWDSTQGTSGGNAHGLFGTISAEAYNGGLLTNGGSCQVDINWDAEGVPSAYDINDSGALYGYFRFGDRVDNRAPVISNGAPNLKVINVNQGPGHWSGAPAAPSSTTSQQNTAWRDAWITLSATTGITVITVDGTATGLTAGNGVSVAIRVPSGKSYAVTYTGTLTTTWWLD